MRRPLLTGAMLAVLTAPWSATAQRAAAPAATIPDPVLLDTTGLFQARFAKVGDQFFIGGQPTERALRELKAQGVTTVVNLRTPSEMTSSVSFDEARLAEELGMKYVHLPVRGGGEFPYSPQTVTKFSEAVRASSGKVLLHCTIAWRASHLWAAYLIQERGIPEVTALANARAINLMDDHRMGPEGRQPVEDFLGRKLPTIGRPPQ